MFERQVELPTKWATVEKVHFERMMAGCQELKARMQVLREELAKNSGGDGPAEGDRGLSDHQCMRQRLTLLVFLHESLKQQEVFVNVVRAPTRRSIALTKDDSAEVTPTVLHNHAEKRFELD